MKKVKEEITKPKKIILTLNNEIYNKIERKRKSLGFDNIQQYLYSIARRDVFRKRVGGKLPELKTAKLFTMKKVLAVDGKPFKI